MVFSQLTEGPVVHSLLAYLINVEYIRVFPKVMIYVHHRKCLYLRKHDMTFSGVWNLMRIFSYHRICVACLGHHCFRYNSVSLIRIKIVANSYLNLCCLIVSWTLEKIFKSELSKNKTPIDENGFDSPLQTGGHPVSNSMCWQCCSELRTQKFIRQNQGQIKIQEIMNITWFISYKKYSRFRGPTQRKDDVPSAQEIPLPRWDNLMIIQPEQWAPKPARRQHHTESEPRI